MRPRKVVLLIDSNEERRSILRFVLDNWGLRVLSAISPAEAKKIARRPDCILGFWPLDAAVANEIARRWDVPLLLASERSTLPIEAVADRLLAGSLCTPASIIEALKTACARRRGPRPQPKPVVAAAAKR